VYLQDAEKRMLKARFAVEELQIADAAGANRPCGLKLSGCPSEAGLRFSANRLDIAGAGADRHQRPLIYRYSAAFDEYQRVGRSRA
jgi:hypothetical protein